MGEWRIFALAAVVLAGLIGGAPALAQAAGVEFVVDGPTTLEEGRAEIEVLNGSSSQQAITVTAEGDNASHISVMGGGSVQPLERLTITVTRVGDSPAQDEAIPLLAVSTDGSVARSSVTVPGADGTSAPLPASIHVRGTSLAPSPISALFGMSTTLFRDKELDGSDLDATGYLSSDTGGVTRVEIDEGSVSIDESDRSGEYTGTIAAGDESIEVTAKAKDVFVWPLALLIAGLWIAYRLEDYLVRRRPKEHLRLILLSLCERTRAFQHEAANQIPRLDDGSEAFRVDRIYSDDGGGSGYLATKAGDIMKGFGQALADFERDMYGPKGTATIELDKNVEAFFQHLRNIVDLARLVESEPAPEARSNVERQVSAVLAGELLDTPAELTDRTKLVTDIRDRLKATIALAGYCRHLAILANEKNRPTEADKATGLASDVLAGVDLSDPKGLDDYRTAANAIRNSIEAPTPAQKLPSTGATVARFPAAPLARYPGISDVGPTGPGDDLVLPEVSAEVRRGIEEADRGFAYASGAVVLLTGLAALYFNDDTFGTVGDYVLVLTWGATVQQGLNLLRRVWASRSTQLAL